MFLGFSPTPTPSRYYGCRAARKERMYAFIFENFAGKFTVGNETLVKFNPIPYLPNSVAAGSARRDFCICDLRLHTGPTVPSDQTTTCHQLVEPLPCVPSVPFIAMGNSHL